MYCIVHAVLISCRISPRVVDLVDNHSSRVQPLNADKGLILNVL